MFHQKSARSLIEQKAMHDPFLVNAVQRYSYTTPYLGISATIRVDPYDPSPRPVVATVYLNTGDKQRRFATAGQAGEYVRNQLVAAINERRRMLREFATRNVTAE